jgi:anti-anti-sigma factor
MAVKPFEAALRREGGTVIIDLAGQIDSFAEERLNAVYQEAAAATPEGIVLNFSAVQYINSTGIALIVGLLAQARKARRELAVFGLSDHYRQIFEITRLADFMSIFPDEESALTEASRE